MALEVAGSIPVAHPSEQVNAPAVVSTDGAFSQLHNRDDRARMGSPYGAAHSTDAEVISNGSDRIPDATLMVVGNGLFNVTSTPSGSTNQTL